MTSRDRLEDIINEMLGEKSSSAPAPDGATPGGGLSASGSMQAAGAASWARPGTTPASECGSYSPDNALACGADRISCTLGLIDRVRGELSRLIDHTLLKADADKNAVLRLCREAREHSFASVCVNPCWIPLASRELQGSPVRACTVVGFPLGASSPKIKAAETRQAVRDGATEIDMVINIGWAKSGDWSAVEEDIRGVVESAGRGVLTKVILETCLLDEEQIVRASLASRRAGADFVKTSTGFSSAGAKAEHVALMRRVVGAGMGVKASGGVRTFEDAVRMVESGADRLGASASVAIVGSRP